MLTTKFYVPNVRRSAVATAALIALYGYSAISMAQPVLPQGGTYQRGAGSITTNGNSAQINTTAAPGKVAVINWGGGFNVGAGGQVTFNNGTGANSLNAINVDPTGRTSSINGVINGTGQGMNILVVNPNGVALGSGARINTTGAFSAIAGNVDPASVQPGQAGTVSIVLSNTPIVVNSAVAGQSSAQGLIGVGAGKAISMHANAASTLPAVIGAADISIAGPGTVLGSGNVAGGGEHYKLNTASSLNFVNASISATNTVAITGKNVELIGTSVNASADGASVKLGGGMRGKDASIANAQVTNVDASSSIATGANSNVVVWGDKANFEGTIVNPGGNAEISGKQLAYSGKTDLRGQGKTGTLLFDPDDIVIDAAGGAYTAQGFGTSGPSTISGAAISSAMQTASVALEANNSIVVQDAITSTATGSNLSMSTGGLLSIGANINIQGDFEGKVGATGAIAPTASPEVRMTPGGAVQTNGGTIKLWTEGALASGNFNAVAGTAIVNGLDYQGTLLNAAGGNVEVTLGIITANGLDIKTTGAGKIDVFADGGVLTAIHQKASEVPGVNNISEGGVWSSQRGNLNVSSNSGLDLQGPTFKTYAGSGETGGNINVSTNLNLIGRPSPTGEKPLQVVAGGATDAVKTGDIFYSGRAFRSTDTSGATIYSGPENDPNGTAGNLNVQPGSIEVGGNGDIGTYNTLTDMQISNQVSWGTNAKSAPVRINGRTTLMGSSGLSTGFSPEPTNGGFFAEGKWYAAGNTPSLGKPATMMSSRPENYSYTSAVSSGDMSLTNMQIASINGVDAGGKLDVTDNRSIVQLTATPSTMLNLKSGGDMYLRIGVQPDTTVGKVDSGGKLSIVGRRGIKFIDDATAANNVSLWNSDITGDPAYAFKFLPGAKVTSNATSGEGMALAAFNFATGFDFGGQPLPLIAPGGRWTYYFTDPSGISADPLFGPAQTFHRYNCEYGGSAGECVNTGDAPAIPTSGTAYLYTHSPILTVDTPTLNATYGTAPDYTAAKTLTGYLGADAGIDIVTGIMAVNGGTFTAAGDFQVGSQDVTYLNGLYSELGYKFSGSQFIVNVAPKEISVASGITGLNKEYDGTTQSSLNTAGASLIGILGSDAVGVSATGTFSDKNAGNNKTVNISNLTLSGADASNYTFGTTGNQLTTQANISQKLVAVTSGLTLDDKVYDGTTQAIVNSSAGVVSGVLAGDTSSVSIGGVTGNYLNKNVGINKVATLSGYTLAGAEGGNYAVDIAASQTSATGNVTQKSITVGGVGNADKVYDATAATSGVAILNGIVSGDNVVGTATGSFIDKNVGNNKTVVYSNFTLGNTDSSNYAIAGSGNTTSGLANIAPAFVVITSGLTVGKEYDGSTGVVADGSAAVISGVFGSDTITANVSGNFADKNAGVGKIATFSAYGLSGADANNYSVNSTASQQTAVGDITKKTVLITSGLTADKVYDGTTIAFVNGSAAVITGKVASDDLTANALGTFSDKNAGVAKAVTVTGHGLTGVDAVNYTLGTAGNQAIIIATISPKDVIVSSSSIAGVDKVYDGNTNAQIAVAGSTVAGQVAGDVLVVNASGTFDTKNVGVDKAVAFGGYGLTGADAGNYTVVGSMPPAPATTASITKRSVDVTGVLIGDKTYDGTTLTSGNASGALLTGILAGDTVGINTGPVNLNFLDPNVGTNKAVTYQSSNLLTGADSGNYLAIQVPTSGAPGTGNIFAATPIVPPVVMPPVVEPPVVVPPVVVPPVVVPPVVVPPVVVPPVVEPPVVVPPVVVPPVVVPPVEPISVALPPQAMPRGTDQSSVFGGWVVNSNTGSVQTTSPELGSAGSMSMASGPISSAGGGTTRAEICIAQAVAIGQKASDAIKQCAVVSIPKATR